jgi:hypothetical protein
MDSKPQSLITAAVCFLFLLLSFAGIGSVMVTGAVTGVDALLMLMICGAMVLLFAWLTYSALSASGLFSSKDPAEAAPAAGHTAAKVQGK